ncbi:hypothetical protein BKA65DRAFT_473366 [Rhexocercosporidium sp. MPI-PUGE-AT-0058]|nr:hypothetical protein BKA65DRAFT_473366 [Rhexocercosporidium sp. MPI-PUGE-AT-0058]
MHVQHFTYAALWTASLVSCIIVPEFPFEGIYSNKPRSSRNVRAPRTVWPDGDCWQYTLDHAGVDEPARDLANWAGNNGNDLCSPGDANIYWFSNRRATIVYYCIDTHGRCGNIDTADVRYALGQMDAHCAPYEASWFKWPQSYEIIGKSRVGDDIEKANTRRIMEARQTQTGNYHRCCTASIKS